MKAAIVLVLMLMVAIGLMVALRPAKETAPAGEQPATTQPTTQPATTRPVAVDPPQDTEPEMVPLSATVNVTGTQLKLMNTGYFGWTNVGVLLNPGSDGGAYELHLEDLGSNDMVVIELRKFTKPDGTLFDPSALEVTTVTVSADTRGGNRGYEVFKFR